MNQNNLFSKEILEKIKQWQTPSYDEETQIQLIELLNHEPQKVIDAFYTSLSFGTAGLRGMMGVGTNRINKYTIGFATQGLSNYLLKTSNAPSAVISYDSRNHSFEFAKETARVFAANGIKVFITKELRPTPFLSFLCTYKNASCGVMITASHNPSTYNGYKVYGKNGGQIIAPDDQKIIEEVRKITTNEAVKRVSFDHPLIHFIEEIEDEEYINAIEGLKNDEQRCKKQGKELKIVFSNLHGTGITLLPKTLHNWGFTNIEYVEKQKLPDGNFPFAKKPNPELEETLALGISQLSEKRRDLLLVTDPDADRLGCVIFHEGLRYILNGNEIASICLYHLLSTYKEQKRLSKNHALVTTIVTTRLLKKMCKEFGIKYFETLTGFKYIGQKIQEFQESVEEIEFLFGAEESYGYLHGTHAKDKDAIVTSAILCEAALKQKLTHQTLLDLLKKIYSLYGVYREKQLSIELEEGQLSQTLIQEKMSLLRKKEIKEIDGVKVLLSEDFLFSKQTNPITLEQRPLLFPTSDVLAFELEDESKFIIRPSGTEPKIKIYGMMRKAASFDVEKDKRECDQFLDTKMHFIKNHLLEL